MHLNSIEQSRGSVDFLELDCSVVVLAVVTVAVGVAVVGRHGLDGADVALVVDSEADLNVVGGNGYHLLLKRRIRLDGELEGSLLVEGLTVEEREGRWAISISLAGNSDGLAILEKGKAKSGISNVVEGSLDGEVDGLVGSNAPWVNEGEWGVKSHGEWGLEVGHEDILDELSLLELSDVVLKSLDHVSKLSHVEVLGLIVVGMNIVIVLIFVLVTVPVVPWSVVIVLFFVCWLLGIFLMIVVMIPIVVVVVLPGVGVVVIVALMGVSAPVVAVAVTVLLFSVLSWVVTVSTVVVAPVGVLVSLVSLVVVPWVDVFGVPGVGVVTMVVPRVLVVLLPWVGVRLLLLVGVGVLGLFVSVILLIGVIVLVGLVAMSIAPVSVVAVMTSVSVSIRVTIVVMVVASLHAGEVPLVSNRAPVALVGHLVHPGVVHELGLDLDSSGETKDSSKCKASHSVSVVFILLLV